MGNLGDHGGRSIDERRYLGRALEALRQRGGDVPSALLTHLAPLGWRHINLTGDYLWPTDAKLEPDGFRAFRTAAMPAAA